jgi:FKBP-type peptidyl-prolyl cis-trans isomerase SlyD
MSIVENGKVVIMHYTLKNEAGEVIDSSAGAEPMPYLHGAANIVEGLENALTGVPVGEKRDVVVSPEEGYGLRQGPGAQEVPRDQFPEGVELFPGMGFHAEGDDGEMMVVYVEKVEENAVWIDGNHPLAGETLYFSVEIMSVRDPSDEELAHGHPHGLDGSVSH